jgi:hypothetical protein
MLRRIGCSRRRFGVWSCGNGKRRRSRNGRKRRGSGGFRRGKRNMRGRRSW